MKKQKNNTGTAVSLTPKINSRRVISTILAVIFMVSMLTVTCFATGTGGTGGGTDMSPHTSRYIRRPDTRSASYASSRR